MAVKTPLKWGGSKVLLMPQLRDHLPEGKWLVEALAGSTEKKIDQYTPDLQKQSRNPLNPFRSPMHLQDPETGEIHVLQRIRPAHHT